MALPIASVRPDACSWRRLLLACVLACVGFASTAARAQDDPPGRVGRVAQASGDVHTVSAEGTWVALVRNQPLSTGDRVVTDKTGRATLQFGSTVVRLGGESDVVVTQLDDQKIRLHFDHGQMAVRVRSDDIPGELFVQTDEGDWVPHHPGQYRFDRVAHQVLAAQAWTGDMLLEAPDSSLPVAAPQRAEVWRAGTPQATHYRVVPAVQDAFGDTVLAQDKLDDQQGAANRAAQVPPEMTGAADLARFGAWSVAQDGARWWTPAKLPVGWHPYQQGAWSWMPPWGWTWVDDQPWGFAPFHYGRWQVQHGRWAWTPGQWGARRPVYAPATVGWFGGTGLAAAGAPVVGWTALAPDEAVYPAYPVSARYWNALNDPSIAPASRHSVAIDGRARWVPTGPVAYANGRLPGALTVVATSALLPRVPVSAMPGPRGAELRQPAFVARLAQAVCTAPPGPPTGRAPLSSASAVVQVPVAAPKAATPSPGLKTVTPPIALARPEGRSAGIGIAKPFLPVPVPVAPLALARPLAPAAAIAPVAPVVTMRPFTAPAAPAPIASR